MKRYGKYDDRKMGDAGVLQVNLEKEKVGKESLWEFPKSLTTIKEKNDWAREKRFKITDAGLRRIVSHEQKIKTGKILLLF